MVVSAVIAFSVMTIVTGFGPQLKVTLPPPESAALKAASVQLAGVPLPTTPAAKAACGSIASASVLSMSTTSTSDGRRPSVRRPHGIDTDSPSPDRTYRYTEV